MKVNLKAPDVKSIPDVLRGLGVVSDDDKITLFYYSSNSPKYLCKAVSKDGLEFEKTISDFSLTDTNLKNVEMADLKNFRMSKADEGHILSYTLTSNGKDRTFLAGSKSGSDWETMTPTPATTGPGIIVNDYKFEDRHVMFAGGKKIYAGFSSDSKKWKFESLDLPERDKYSVDFVTKTSNGIFLIYHTHLNTNGRRHLEIRTLNLDLKDPKKITWHTNSSVLDEPKDWKDTVVRCLGYVNFKGKLISYWDTEDQGIMLMVFPVFESKSTFDTRRLKLDKHHKNPILTPGEEKEWEKEGVFNPAAFLENGKVYLLYRAVSSSYISVIGKAESGDGIHFEKHGSPVYTASEPFDTLSPNFSVANARKYMSGGGYGGVEDPRVTRIGNKLYMVYVAFNGYEPPRLAMTSILINDFVNNRYLWEKPVLISPPGIIDKSGCILPEKINGKFVIFHRIYPNILIDYVDSLKFDGNTWLKGEYQIQPRPTMWDSRKVGVGAPPIKTKDGWLLIYQAVGEGDPSKYKIGAMLLDINDPTKVLHRSNQPIIEPTEHYENNLAKFGVVYPCGAVVLNDQLFVYYGGSDSVTCVATTKLDKFLDELKSHDTTHLVPLDI